MIKYLSIGFVILLMTSLVCGQEEEIKSYALKDSLVVEAERVSKFPIYNSIAAKVPISIQQTPASVEVVTSATFSSQNGIVLGDALKNISGVNIQSNFGTTDYFLIRGFDSLTNGLVLTDGTAEPEVSFYNLYNVQRIEVLKGPSAFLYGGNPLSGAVNLVRKKPMFVNFSRFSGSYGNYATFRGTADLNVYKPSMNLAFRLNALYQESDNYRDNKSNDNKSINPALTLRIGNRSILTANYEYVRSSYRPDSGLPLLFQSEGGIIPDVPRTNSYQSPVDQSEQQISRVQIDFNTKINDFISIQSRTYFTDLDWVSKGTLIDGAFQTSPSNTSVNRFLLELRDRQKLLGNQLEALFSFETGSIEHKLLTGYEVSRLTDDFTLLASLLPGIDLFNPVETFDPRIPLFPLQGEKGDARSTVYAPYFVDKISFLDRCIVFAGGRYDVINFDEKINMTERSYKKFSPMFGFGYSPIHSISFYGNAGKAFAPPSSRVIGDRKPEESTQFEGGVKKRLFENKLNATLAFYQLEKDNIAIPDDNGVTQQIGSQRSRGIEFQVMAKPHRNMVALFSYAYTDAELTEFGELSIVGFDQSFNPIFLVIDRSGNKPAFVPNHILNLWVTQEFRNGVGIGAGGRYLSSQYISEDNAFEIDSYLLIDATVFYNYKGMRLGLNFKNLTNKEYEMRGFGSGSVIPANPRSLYLSADWSI